MLWPPPKEEDLRELYQSPTYFKGDGESGYWDYERESSLMSRTYQVRHRLLGLKPLGQASILEVGCGTGTYGDFLKSQNYVGMEINPIAARQARDRGLNIIEGEWQKTPDSTFDCAAFFDVLEHLLHPEEFLQNLRCKLRKNGKIWFTTPSTGSFLAKVMGRNWVSYKRPEHVLLYQRKNLSRLLQQSGFEVLRTVPDWQWYSTALIRQKLRMRHWNLIPAFVNLPLLIPNGNLLVLAQSC